MSDMRPQGEIGPPTPDAPGHEADAISARGVFMFALGLVALGVVIHFVLGLVMGHYSARETSNEAARPPLLATPVEPPSPRLQGNPPLDRAREQARQRADLDGYGWVDRPAGIVHIPIRRAIDILAERGLPEIQDQPGPGEPARAKPAEKAAGKPEETPAPKPAEKPAAKSAQPASPGTGKKRS